MEGGSPIAATSLTRWMYTMGEEHWEEFLEAAEDPEKSGTRRRRSAAVSWSSSRRRGLRIEIRSGWMIFKRELRTVWLSRCFVRAYADRKRAREDNYGTNCTPPRHPLWKKAKTNMVTTQELRIPGS